MYFSPLLIQHIVILFFSVKQNVILINGALCSLSRYEQQTTTTQLGVKIEDEGCMSNLGTA